MFLAVLKPSLEIFFATSLFLYKYIIAFESPNTSFFDVRIPFFLFFIISLQPPTLVAITGNLNLKYSRIALGKPSSFEHNIPKLQFDKIFSNSRVSIQVTLLNIFNFFDNLTNFFFIPSSLPIQ